ncbi:MAG: FIST C-terminal domain-containing protein [Reichenbachiella sp.]
MKVEQKIWNTKSGWTSYSEHELGTKVNLVFALGPIDLISQKRILADLQKFYPNADIVLSSAYSNIFNTKITKNDDVVVSALQFEKTTVQALHLNIKEVKDSFDLGTHISANLNKENIKGLLVFSDSFPIINASHLVTGLHFNLSEHIPILGGLASGHRGERPMVGLNELPKQGNVIGIGLSGDYIQIGHGIDIGWTPFGTERFITKSKDNVVYQLDHMTPYELYELYLKDLVEDVSEAARQFPLGIYLDTSTQRLIRTVIDVDKKTGAVTYSGEVPQGEKARMMKTNISKLIDAAGEAAERSCSDFKIKEPDFSFLVNCKGRQAVLEDWAQEEIDTVITNLGKNTPVMGYYSLGEIAPLDPGKKGELLNQTITITSLKEN